MKFRARTSPELVSVTSTRKVLVPGEVLVPDSTPDEERAKPGGRGSRLVKTRVAGSGASVRKGKLVATPAVLVETVALV